MEEILDKITDFGDRAHGEQLRKYAPDRYMVHPVRVMRTLQHHTKDLAVLAAALLHDVLEDTPITEDEILQFLNTVMDTEDAERALRYTVELTDVFIKIDYPRLNRRTRKAKEVKRLSQISPEAQSIKYADILDNASEISVNDPDFARVYLNESMAILKALDKGNAEIRQQAEEMVTRGLAKLKRR